MGYTLRTIKISINEENELPAFNKWKRMFIDGLKVFIVGILYYIIPTIFIMIGIFLMLDFSTATFKFPVLNPAAIMVLSIGALLYILFMFLYEIGIANMAYHRKLEAALSFREIMDIIRKIGWKKYLAVFIILLIITGISNLIGIISGRMSIYWIIIFAILISPYLALIRHIAIGLIYKEAL